jgi:hypothetical protein
LGQEPQAVRVDEVRIARFELGVPGEPKYIASYEQIALRNFFCQRYGLNICRSLRTNRQQSEKPTTVAVLAKLQPVFDLVEHI